MNLKSIAAAALATLILSPAVASADPEQFPLQINVTATVPTSTGLQISPVGDWAGETQDLPWNMTTQRLEPVQKQIDMKSGLGAITAHLAYDAKLAADAGEMPMTVSVAGKALAVGPAAAVEVATEVEAAAGKRALVSIAAAPVGGEYLQGNYSGTVSMMFESRSP
ncbi:TPA: CS1 type fimbrial major subunit [Stenotrophomonas maltophilia]